MEDLKPRAAAGGQGKKFYANHLLHKRGRDEDKRQSLQLQTPIASGHEGTSEQLTYPPQSIFIYIVNGSRTSGF